MDITSQKDRSQSQQANGHLRYILYGEQEQEQAGVHPIYK